MKTLEEIFETKRITDSSKKLYTSNLIRLNDGKEITNFKFLESPENIAEMVSKSKPNTQRNYYIAICSIMSELKKDSKKYQKLYDIYYKILMDLNVSLKDQTKMTDTETENWITQDEITHLLNKSKLVLDEIKNKRKISPEIYDRLLDLVILGLYTLMPPRRNIDYILMKIIPEDNTEFNYLDLKNKQFILNNYKTAGTYKTQKIDINPELFEIIKKYVNFRPDKSNTSNTSFLVKYDGTPFTESNQMSKRLNDIFGKKISSSMLRKMYLTDKYSDTIEEMKKDAEAMGTSTSVMTTNYIKNTSI
jgi:hypothetical protein